MATGYLTFLDYLELRRRGRQETHLRDEIEQLFGRNLMEDAYEPEREMRLSDDGELVTIGEYKMKRKRN